MRKTLILAALLAVAATPAAQACSIAYNEFGHAAWEGDRVWFDRGQSIKVLHLTTGLEQDWEDAFFPGVGAGGGRVVVVGQDGLGADCSGTTWLRVQDPSTGVVQHEGDKALFAVWDGGFVWYDNGVNWRTWAGQTGKVAGSDLGVGDDVWDIGLAVSADGALVALMKGDGSDLRVLPRTGGAALDVDMPTIENGRGDGSRTLAFSADGQWLARAVMTDDGATIHVVPIDGGDGWTFDLTGEGFAWPPLDMAWTTETLVVRLQKSLVGLDPSDGSMVRYVGPSDRAPGALAAQDGRMVIMWRTASAEEGKALLILDAAGEPDEWHVANAGLWTERTVPVTQESRADAAVFGGPPGNEGGEGKTTPHPAMLGLLALGLMAFLRRRNA